MSLPFGFLRFLPVLMIGSVIIGACSQRKAAYAPADNATVNCAALHDSINAIVDGVSGDIGVAVIINGRDTVTVNNSDIYPLMSVFKLHQAIALCHNFDTNGISIDTVVSVSRSELNPDTWSPMMKEHTAPNFNISVRDLMIYTLAQSDNNASNLMFDRLVPVAETDSFIATLVPHDGFRIAAREADMQRDHTLSYANHSSPLATAMLLDRLFTDSIISEPNQQFIREVLLSCKTGVDRISAPLAGKEGVRIAHKTGSGYINERGQLIAHNDAAYVMLPDGTSYSIAVFVKDFAGNEKEASQIISRISSAVYDTMLLDLH